ncbi:hypothetical protein EVAR_48700_1 [Eumeta japonica]|uniref:Uncharacterized protein n=1 Tax=Eumeta variegata TaxID=151549 RepID=A0A4C1XAR6_EUMVA|nr:hypothetical protein EVAR_48700_1 [Eumeta japonica]
MAARPPRRAPAAPRCVPAPDSAAVCGRRTRRDIGGGGGAPASVTHLTGHGAHERSRKPHAVRREPHATELTDGGRARAVSECACSEWDVPSGADARMRILLSELGLSSACLGLTLEPCAAPLDPDKPAPGCAARCSRPPHATAPCACLCPCPLRPTGTTTRHTFQPYVRQKKWMSVRTTFVVYASGRRSGRRTGADGGGGARFATGATGPGASPRADSIAHANTGRIGVIMHAGAGKSSDCIGSVCRRIRLGPTALGNGGPASSSVSVEKRRPIAQPGCRNRRAVGSHRRRTCLTRFSRINLSTPRRLLVDAIAVTKDLSEGCIEKLQNSTLNLDAGPLGTSAPVPARRTRHADGRRSSQTRVVLFVAAFAFAINVSPSVFVIIIPFVYKTGAFVETDIKNRVLDRNTASERTYLTNRRLRHRALNIAEAARSNRVRRGARGCTGVRIDRVTSPTTSLIDPRRMCRFKDALASPEAAFPRSRDFHVRSTRSSKKIFFKNSYCPSGHADCVRLPILEYWSLSSH